VLFFFYEHAEEESGVLYICLCERCGREKRVAKVLPKDMKAQKKRKEVVEAMQWGRNYCVDACTKTTLF
jgi:hypothetical protein